MADELQDIVKELFSRICPMCGILAHMKLTGLVYYTSPAWHEWRCEYCNTSGQVSYDGIPIRHIPDENLEAYYNEASGTLDVQKLHELSKKYGVQKKPNIKIMVDI